MPVFAHICPVTSQVLDPIERASEADYIKLWHPDVIGGWTISQVPATTVEGKPIKHGARDNGDGTYTNQEDIPPPPPVYHEPVEETEPEGP